METTRSEGPSDAFSSALAYVHFWAAWVFAVVASVTAFTSGLLALFMPRAMGRHWQYLCGRAWGGSICWFARCPIEVTHLSDARPLGGFVYMSNHSSTLDILALFASLHDTPFVFAAKRELFNWPVIGWHLRLAGFVEVDRQHRDRAVQMYAKAAQEVRGGRVVALYPEGTRSVDGSVLPFKKGPFVLALEAQVPIVPVAVDGAQHALRKHTLRLHGHPIRIVVGKPIETKGLTIADRDDLLRRVRLAILEQHRMAGAGPSTVEPMIAPPGQRSGERES